jgi:hypothetical protein
MSESAHGATYALHGGLSEDESVDGSVRIWEEIT